VYRVLVGKLKGKKPLRRPRLRWEDRIVMDHGDWLGECVMDRFFWLRIGTGVRMS
jgi:hypothetical protein